MKKDRLYDIVEGFIIVFFVVWAAWMLSGCMTPKKAVDYLKKKELLADTCAANYPVIVDTLYKEGDLIIETNFLPGDTLVFFDTINQWRIDTIRKACPPSKVSTIWRVDTFMLTKLDSAKLAALREKYEASIKDSAKWKSKAKARGKWQWGLGGLSVLLFVLIGFILGKKIK
jgi:hypothetical protein